MYSDARSSFRYFWATWRASWSYKLRFRGKSQHAACSTCIVHKLIIRQLGGDLVRRIRQIELLSEHRLDQYKDRRFYWGIRAEAALSPLVITLIIDGMDQSKFCCPRSEFVFKSKLLEGMQRPRLHVNALIAHHKFVMVAVSRADFPKKHQRDHRVGCARPYEAQGKWCGFAESTHPLAIGQHILVEQKQYPHALLRIHDVQRQRCFHGCDVLAERPHARGQRCELPA